jgi:hypothetical protein
MLTGNDTGADAGGRIRPDDTLITRPEVQVIMGGLSTSALYEDPDLMSLKVVVVAGEHGGPSRHVRWISREVHELRARRVARSEEKAAGVRTAIEQRRERRRAKRLKKAAAANSAA